MVEIIDMKDSQLHVQYGTNPSSLVVVLIASNAVVVVTSLIFTPFILVQNVAPQPSINKDPNLKVESLVSRCLRPQACHSLTKPYLGVRE
jgi:hypothetical protein